MTEAAAPPARPTLAFALPNHWYVVGPVATLGPHPRAITDLRPYGRASRGLRARSAATARAPRTRLPTATCGTGTATGPAPADPPTLPQLASPRTVWERGTVAVEVPSSHFRRKHARPRAPHVAHPWTHPSWWLHRLGVLLVFETQIA